MLPDQSWRAVSELSQPVELENYLITEIYKALGWELKHPWQRWLQPLFLAVVRNFAREASSFDNLVSNHGFHFAAQEYIKRWMPDLRINGKEALPSDGPLIIAANHPGTFDGLAIASAINRPDLRIITAANPFFRTLPHSRNYFIYSTLDTHVRMATIRSALRHLQAGGCLLIFPSGKLDPDPLHFPAQAIAALQNWSKSLVYFLRKVAGTKLVVAINQGFVAHQYLNHPFIRFQSSGMPRQKLAEFLQVISQIVFKRRVTFSAEVSFSSTLISDPSHPDDELVFQKILITAQDLLTR